MPAAGGKGERLGTFELHELLGAGAMGEVYRARDLRLGREVALKLLPERLSGSADLLARFEREARVLASLNHPHIATLHDLAEDSGTRFLVMELVPGETLAQRLADGALPVQEALALFDQLADALTHAHEQGIVHRDLKPANIKITSEGQLKVLDFGLAKALSAVAADPDAPTLAPGDNDTLRTVEGALVGTVPYMSPEQARGQSVDKGADIWAFGCLLYQCLSGRHPFPGDTAADVISRILSSNPDWSALPDDVPAGVRTLLRRCLEPASSDRLQDIGEARSAVRQARLAGESGTGAGSPEPEGFRTILLTRVASDLRQRLGMAKAAAALGLHEELFGRCLERCHGFAEERAGDSFVATFALPSQALRCALDVQLALSELDLAKPLGVGMALHVGEVTGDLSDTNRLAGPAMDAAARLLGLAEPDQILLTEVVFDAGRQEATHSEEQPLAWLAHGPYLFAGQESSTNVFEVGVPGRSRLRPPQDTEVARRAVVPGEDETLGWRPARGLTVPGRAHWLLEERLGEGGFGEVWRASHEKTKAKRAFKFCFDPQRVRGLQREVVLFRLLKETLGERDDIAQILDWQFDEAPYFLEVEHTEGGDLAQWAASQGGLTEVPLEARLEIAAQIATALAAAHGVGVLHKDVKPANILISENPETGEPHAVLTDFGIGLVTDRDALVDSGITVAGFTKTLVSSSSGSGTGTPLYMAPEVLEGKPATTHSDLYSLGVVLYQLVTGDFSRVVAPGWERGVEDELLREDIAACVDGEPEQRLASAGELSQRLRGLQERRAERVAEAQRRAEAQRLRLDAEKAKGRRRVLSTIAVTAGAVSILVTLAALRENRVRRQAEALQYVSAIQLAGSQLEMTNVSLAREALLRTPRHLRGWEWGHLVDRAWRVADVGLEPLPPQANSSVAESWRGAEAIVVARLSEHTQKTWIRYGPDGRLLSRAGTEAKIWAPPQSESLVTVEHTTEVHDAVLSHDGQVLATTHLDGTAGLWDATTGSPIRILEGHSLPVMAAFFSPDDSLLVTSSNDLTLRVWDALSGRLLHVLLEGPEVYPVLDVRFLSGSRLLVPSRGNRLSVWDLSTGRWTASIPGPKRSDMAPIELNPDGVHVLSAKVPDILESLLVWSTDGEVQYSPPHFPGGHHVGFAFSPDGCCLAILSPRGEVQLLEVGSGIPLAYLSGPAESGNSIAWNPSGDRLAVAQQDGTIVVLAPARRTQSRDRLLGHEDAVLQAVWSSDGDRLASVSYDGRVRIWDVTTRQAIHDLPHDAEPLDAEFSPDGKLLFTSTIARYRVWDSVAGELLFEWLSGHSRPEDTRNPFFGPWLGPWSTSHFSPDGSRIALAFADVGVLVLDSTSRREILSLPTDAPNTGIVYGPRGARILTVAQNSPSAIVWDAESGQRLYSLDAESALGVPRFSPDGRRIAAGTYAGKVKTWDAADGSELLLITGHQATVRSVRFDHTGELLVSAARDRSARVWNATTGEPLATLAGYQLGHAEFSPDADRVLTMGSGGTIIWDLHGNALVSLRAGADENQARWSPDGRTIAAPLDDGSVQLWDSIPWPELAALGDDSLTFEDRVQLWRDQQDRHQADHP